MDKTSKKQVHKQKLLSIVNAEIEDEKHLLFTAFIVVLTSLVVINTIFWIGHYSGTGFRYFTTNSGQIKSVKVLTSQQKGSTPTFDTTISGVSEQSKFDPAFTISSDETFLIMDVSITNNSSGLQDLIPVNQLYVRDREGGYYPMHPSSLVTSPLAAATLKPGRQVSGQVSFAVPKTLAHPLLYIDLGWEDYTPVIFDVLR